MRAMRSIIGSGLYNFVFIGWTAVCVVMMLILLPFPRMAMQRAVKAWAWSQHWALKGLVGLDFEIRGAEHIPKGGAIYASKHQSAWDTYFFYLLFADPSYVLKKELVKIPVWGWIARKCEAVSVDREGGATALKTLVRDVKQRLSEDRPVIIFPEGTRTQPGSRRPYHPGVAALYSQCDAPVVPVALNSGLFWGRRSYTKQAGRIVIEFFEPIESGLKRRDFMQRLETTVETAALKLAEEGVQRFPLTEAAMVRHETGPETAANDISNSVD